MEAAALKTLDKEDSDGRGETGAVCKNQNSLSLAVARLACVGRV